MAAMLLRGLKGVNVSCASPASTAICSNTEQRPSLHRFSSRSLRESHKLRALGTPPFVHPKHKSRDQSSRKSTDRKSTDRSSTIIYKPTDQPWVMITPTNSSRCLLDDDSSDSMDVFYEPDSVPDLNNIDSSRFHSAAGDEPRLLRPKERVYFRSASASSNARAATWAGLRNANNDRSIKSSTYRPSASYSSSSTSTEAAISFGHSASLPSSSLRRLQGTTKGNETPVFKSSSSARSREEVVVLRVSLHCKGCEGKVRKHLSKMQGVTSFSIDFATKKVTVTGDVTPLGVLSSVSKVKNAQFWASPSP